jgi:hypothetical protein
MIVSQKTRPISFVLHDTANGIQPIFFPLSIRPEELTRAETSRLTASQTFGGAWADNFGAGIPTVNISGHTGWGVGYRPAGRDQFETLHRLVFAEWHRLRDQALKKGVDPDKVKLIFSDKLDNFDWVVAPQSFSLRRSKSRPLLFQYQISLLKLSDDVKETMEALDRMLSGSSDDSIMKALDSLMDSITKLDVKGLTESTGKVMGALAKPFNKLLEYSRDVLDEVVKKVTDAKGVVQAVTNGLLDIASALSRAAANATHTVMAIFSFPDYVKAQLVRVSTAFNNAFCTIQNIFTRRKYIPNYDGIFGASTCSSTAGGKPISQFANENPFASYAPNDRSEVLVDTRGYSALMKLKDADPVLRPMSAAELSSNINSLLAGAGVG